MHILGFHWWFSQAYLIYTHIHTLLGRHNKLNPPDGFSILHRWIWNSYRKPKKNDGAQMLLSFIQRYCQPEVCILLLRVLFSRSLNVCGWSLLLLKNVFLLNCHSRRLFLGRMAARETFPPHRLQSSQRVSPSDN